MGEAMTDQHDVTARDIVEERICCTAAQHCRVEALAARIAAALRAAYEAGQRDMRDRAAADAGAMEGNLTSASRLRALPIKGADHG